MKIIRLLSAVFMFMATFSLTMSLIFNNLPIQALGVFCLGSAGLLAIIQLILDRE